MDIARFDQLQATADELHNDVNTSRDFAAQDIRWGGLSPVDLGKQAADYANGDIEFAVFVLDYYRDEVSPDFINLQTAWFAYQKVSA